MSISTFGALVGAATFVVSLLSFYLSLRSVLKKNAGAMADSLIKEEKRHSSHEKSISVIRERIALIDKRITSRLDEISIRLNEMSGMIIQNIRESKR